MQRAIPLRPIRLSSLFDLQDRIRLASEPQAPNRGSSGYQADVLEMRTQDNLCDPLVSVIIPTLNAAGMLPRCLESIERQNYSAIEVLVVDGGSWDLTTRVAEERGAKLVKGQFGRSSARRRGAMDATGKYILFLDADQRIEPNTVRQCVQLCESEGFSAVKIPEKDDGDGVWARCRFLERQITATEELSYPRFFSRSSYFAIGAHANDLEDYMEDRDLYLRLVAQKYHYGWCNAAIINVLGRVNPIQLGLRGGRAAQDSAAYYRRNAERGETVWLIIKPRIFNLLRNAKVLRHNFVAAVLLPSYLLMVYGPRLVRACFGSLLSRRRN